MATTISIATSTSTSVDGETEWLTEDGTVGRLRDTQTYIFDAFGSLSIPAGSTIDGIEIIMFGTSGGVDGPDENWIYVSNDGATSWSTGKDVTTAPWGLYVSGTTNAQIERAGGASELWGETWNATTAAAIQVKCANAAGLPVYVDYIKVEITYTAAAVAEIPKSLTITGVATINGQLTIK
tara:strand:+ start:38 stop:580 length:543 start_codon:yes stop_codon:yes gene_type:complete